MPHVADMTLETLGLPALEWVETGVPNGGEDLVATSGWMLARVTRGATRGQYLWCVSTHRSIINNGTVDRLGQAKHLCDNTIAARYWSGWQR